MKFSSVFSVTATLLAATKALVIEQRDAAPGYISFPLHVNERAIELRKRHVKRSGEVSEVDTNYNKNLLYIIELSLGTPPQTIYVQLDTGSSDLVVETPSSDICSAAAPNPCTKFGSCE
jgi:hypothetical protein